LGKKLKGIGFYVILIAVLLLLVYSFADFGPAKTQRVYSDLQQQIHAGNVTELSISGTTATAKLAKPIEETRKEYGKTITKKTDVIEVEIPNQAVFEREMGETIRAQIAEGKLKYAIEPMEGTPWWISLLPILGTVLLFVFVYIFFMRQSGGGGKAMSFGKSRARMMDPSKKKVTFADVAGAEEEKADLEEIVAFLKEPRRFTQLGAKIPRGVLLVGPPGTGKTLLAKAVAGEAGVPFFSISGSDFVEMFVGVGASRVRDLFEQAKKNSPCIVFIDEIDAVGRHRGAGLGGGHDEREQTLNQLLVEMDGFSDNNGVIILAATNRPDILDPALLRPGRFDRQVVVGRPDVRGREDILKVHSKNKPLAADVDLSVIAKSTAGFTGADLANLMNEAALLAAREHNTHINAKHLADAMLKVVIGTEKKSRKITEIENKLTAYHEAGHAVAAHKLESQDPVQEISIIPRGLAGGYTLQLPGEDKWYSSKREMLDEIVVFLGGRVAEKLTLDDISTGASNDIERATALAREMVTKYGMSDDLGPVNYSSSQEVFLGKDIGHSKDYSEEVASKIDKEIKKIIDDAYVRCEEILRENIDALERVAQTLLEREKLTSEEFVKVFNGEKLADVVEPPKPAVIAPQEQIAEEQFNENTKEENENENH